MAKRKRRAFTKEFKAQAVRIVRESGKSVGAVARNVASSSECSPQEPRRWHAISRQTRTSAFAGGER